MKKTLFPLAILLAVSGLNADMSNDRDMRNRDGRGMMDRRSDETCYRKEKCCINPPARPDVKCGMDIFITGEVLYWKATEKGLDYAVLIHNSDTDPSIAPSGLVEIGAAHHPHFDWDWGSRIGVGYNSHHDGWDLYLDWTRFHKQSKSHIATAQVDAEADSPADYLFSRFSAVSTSQFSKASARWKLRLDMIDLELGREFYVSRWLTLRPFVGARTAWIKQKLRPHFIALNELGEESLNYLIRLKNNFWGIGVRAGLNTEWAIGCGWSIYGNAAMSILAGHFKERFHEVNDGFNITSGLLTEQDQLGIREHLSHCAAIADLAVGLRYDMIFGCDDDYHLGFWAGFEEHVFFEQSQFLNFDTASYELPGSYVTDGGNLTTYGVTGGIEFGF